MLLWRPSRDGAAQKERSHRSNALETVDARLIADTELRASRQAYAAEKGLNEIERNRQRERPLNGVAPARDSPVNRLALNSYRVDFVGSSTTIALLPGVRAPIDHSLITARHIVCARRLSADCARITVPTTLTESQSTMNTR